MARKKIEKEEEAIEIEADVHTDVPVVSEKDKLLALYKTLKDLGINSIGDLENKIARL